METELDRLAYIRALGGLVVYCPLTSIEAIFDAAYVNADGADEASPALTARSSDIAAAFLRKGDSVRVADHAYRVRAFEPDGTGMTVIRLGA